MIVRHSRGEYAVRFGRLAELAPVGCFAITDQNVNAAWGHAVPAGSPRLVLPAGEPSKCLETFGEALRWLASNGARRDATVLALGGGVVGDLAGFVAASYMRGVACVQAPTSLLAMVDASVGGKVGIDLPEGKNLVGAFAPPLEVLIDTATLATLPSRELVNGAAEVWKMGAILDAALWQALEADPIRPGHPDTERIVHRCIELKKGVVEADEFESSGLRATLNFGHTVGHAIESAQQYRGVLHGEAVAVGMVVEAHLGERLGRTAIGTAERISVAMRAQGLPTRIPGLDPDDLIRRMMGDKKAIGAGLSFSLLASIGQCTLVRGVEDSLVREVLSQA